MTVLDDTVNPGQRLLLWAWKLGKQGIFMDDATEGLERGKAVDRALGVLHHDGRPCLTRGQFKPDQWPYIEGLVDWWQVTQPEILGLQIAVHCVINDVTYRGYIDYARRCGGAVESLRVPPGHPPRFCDCNGSGVVIGDQKTGSTSDVKAQVQVGGAYPFMWRASGMQPSRVCKAELVGIGVKGSGYKWYVVEAEGTPVDYLRAVRWHQSMKRLGYSER